MAGKGGGRKRGAAKNAEKEAVNSTGDGAGDQKDVVKEPVTKKSKKLRDDSVQNSFKLSIEHWWVRALR